MNEFELSRIDDSKYNGVVTAIKRPKKIYENPLIIGFDVQFRLSGRKSGTLELHFSKGDESRIYRNYDAYWGLDTPPYYSNGKYNIQILIDYLFQFLADIELDAVKDTLYLVTHNAHEELSHFEIPKGFKLLPINKGLCLEGKIKHASLDNEIKLKVIDLYSLVPKSLKDIGDYINSPRLTLYDISEKYKVLSNKESTLCIRTLSKVLCERILSEAYGKYNWNDAPITYEAYTKLRSIFVKKNQADLLNFYTISSLSGYLLRRDYIDKQVVKTKIIREQRKQKKYLADGIEEYYDILQKKEIYDGDLNVRKYAMLAYQGARIESFCRGRFENAKLAYYDVDSLYPSSSILQPLPQADTKWLEYTSKNSEKFLNQAEGYVEVEFRYSQDTLYPCLPVLGLRDNILYFPLSGKTYCTMSELRMAIKLGLKDYKILSGYGFYPTKRERKHPLANFMKDLLESKQQSDRGSLEYSMYKMQMNSLVGKFAQRDKNNETLSLIHEGSITRDAYGKIDKFRKSTVGLLWYPEWASLILGKARALMSEFISMGTYFVSSDSVLLPKDVDINCDSLQELRSVGSDLRKEFDVDHGIIIRPRLFALNPLSENPKLRHLARHAVSCEPEDYRKIMIDGYQTRSIPDLSFTSKKVVKYEKSILEGKKLNSMEIKESMIDIKWDGKRKLFIQIDNPFCDFSWSGALDAEEVENNYIRKPHKKKPGRKTGKELDTTMKRDIKRYHNEGMRNTDIAKKVGVSPSWVSRVCKQLRAVKKFDA